jgi:hemolysin activation/secretion protein
VRLEAASLVEPDPSETSDGPRAPYARGAGEITLSRGVGDDVLGALTLSAGSSAGDLPPQRRWWLGGAHTIRGQRPDTAVGGNAYWMTQGELARDLRGVRGIVFGDLGWTGDRSAMQRHAFGRPMSSAGVGASFLDGLIRLDVARGIQPRKQWRVNAYVEARM